MNHIPQLPDAPILSIIVRNNGLPFDNIETSNNRRRSYEVISEEKMEMSHKAQLIEYVCAAGNQTGAVRIFKLNPKLNIRTCVMFILLI
jgi:hypothetical protein